MMDRGKNVTESVKLRITRQCLDGLIVDFLLVRRDLNLRPFILDDCRRHPLRAAAASRKSSSRDCSGDHVSGTMSRSHSSMSSPSFWTGSRTTLTTGFGSSPTSSATTSLT